MLSTSSTATSQTIVPKLKADGSNWIVWKTRIQILIEAKKLAHLLDDSIAPPAKPEPLGTEPTTAQTSKFTAASEEYQEFRQNNAQVKHFIVSTIPDTLLIKTINCSTANDLWKVVCAEHETKTKRFAVEMLRNLQNQRCSETDDVKQHFAKMLTLREELAATGKVIDEIDFTSILTNSLPPSYDNVVSSAYSAASAVDKEITTSRIIAVIQEECSRRQISSGNTHSTSTALFSNPQKPSLRRNGPKKAKKDLCTNQKCRYRHSHEFKDCRSEGGPLHEQKPSQPRNRPTGRGGRRGVEGRNAQQIMRANVVHEEEDSLEHAFSVAILLSVADSDLHTVNPSERIEVYDSGASCHMSPYIEAFTEFTSIEPKPISAADSRTFKAIGKGSIQIQIPNGDGSTSVTLRDVLYAPTIGFTLISLSRADKAGYSTLIRDGDLHLLDRKNDSNVIGRIPARNGLWSVKRTVKALESGANPIPGAHAFVVEKPKALEGGVNPIPGTHALADVSLMDLHRCLGHISPAAITRLVDRKILNGINIRDRDVEFCEVCALAKIKRRPFPKSRTHPARNIGDVVHTDLWGPAQVIGLGGGQYAVTFIDERSRFGVLGFTHTKGESFQEYKNYESWLRVQFGWDIKCLQSDRGGEFTSNEFNEYLRQRGTIRRLTVHDSPQSNGIAKRCNGVLLGHARALLIDSGLPKFLWKEAMRFSMWIRNRTTTHHLDGQTPYEVLYGVKPEIGGIHLWGSRVWVRSLTVGKLDPRGREGRFVGYDAESKGFRVYWTDSRTIGVERDLIFEDRPMDGELILLPDTSVTKGRPKPTSTIQPPTAEPTIPPPVAPISPADIPLPPANDDELVENEAPTPVPASSPTPDVAEGKILNANPGAEQTPRARKPSPYAKRLLSGEADGGTARGKSRIPKGLQLPSGLAVVDDEDELPTLLNPEVQSVESAMAVQIENGTSDDDPKTLMQAMTRPDWSEWEKAMEEEIALMRKYKVWDVVDSPDDTNIVGSRWVFRIKRDSSGKILKYRARLVAQGFTQMYGIDFQDTFAPVARLSSIRAVIALAASEDWELHQMDVKSAYLNSPIDTPVYMRLPPGYTQKGKVAKVNRGLYGLRQSGNLWHKTLTYAFNNLGLTRSAVDHGVFYSHDDNGTTIVCSSTDDFAIAATTIARMTEFKTNLGNHFEMSDLGELAWILGIKVDRDRPSRTISLSQTAYIDSIAKRFNLIDAPPLSMPIDPNALLSKSQSPSTPRQFDDMSNIPYREAIGSLMYAAIGTRPDITFAVTALSQYLQNPGRPHWEQAKRTIRYLKGTREWKLTFGATGGVEGFSDANWGNDVDDRHSICGYIFVINGGAISWSSKKQSVVALSSTEAEYIGITHAAKEAIWVRHLLSELYTSRVLDYPITIHCDNRSAIELVKNATFHSRTKHIAIRYHYIREAFNDGLILLAHRGTDNMPADMFTKVLARVKLSKFTKSIGVSST